MTTAASDRDTLEGLNRTLLLLRDHIQSEVSDFALAEGLLRTRIAVIGDRRNLRTESAQHALVATALLSARWGASVYVAVPDLDLLGCHAPLRGDQLGGALLDALDDLIPGVHGSVQFPRDGVDLAVLIGDTAWSGQAMRVLRLQADAWSGTITSGTGARWAEHLSPFGALASAGLAAGEGFKGALGRFRRNATDVSAFDLLFAPADEATVRLAPPGSPPPRGDLGVFDCVSGGAIIQAALYALSRIPSVSATLRIIEPEHADLTNLNRYALLRRSRVGIAKAVDLAEVLPAAMSTHPLVARYDANLRERLGSPAPRVLVGVDDIPSRWEVQRARPLWLGVGATTHYSAMASHHVAGLGCAWCLHPKDEPYGGPIPTVSFVSHWAGLWLASLFARERIDARPLATHQSVYFTSLRADSATAAWFAPVLQRPDCPLECRTWK